MQNLVEPLEQRRLLASASIVSGVLTITGTSAVDNISVQVLKSNNTQYLVLLNGVKKYFGVTAITTSTMSVDLGAGNDNFEVNNINGNVLLDSTILGGDGNDVIQGGKQKDSIVGGNGDDLLYGDHAQQGGIGNDTIYGGAGKDRIYGIGGNDFIDGGDDADLLQGDDGNDFIRGGKGNDTLNGNAGDDNLQGQQGNDALTGGDGNDRLFGSTGLDTLIGGNGGDDLDAGDDSDLDFVEGDKGNDDFFNCRKGEIVDYKKDKFSNGTAADTGPNTVTDPVGAVRQD